MPHPIGEKGLAKRHNKSAFLKSPTSIPGTIIMCDGTFYLDAGENYYLYVIKEGDIIGLPIRNRRHGFSKGSHDVYRDYVVTKNW